MLKAVLFDLDGTLLDIDLQGFLADYFAALGPHVAEICAVPQQAALDAVMSATSAMCEPHPGQTNQEVFDRVFTSLTGTDLTEDVNAARIERFYGDEFPGLQGAHGPRDGGVAAVEAARSCGLMVAITTNPIFPREAILERIRWAGLGGHDFDLVTTYENAIACKPHPDYYRWVAKQLGVDPKDCLMVGDDPVLDLSAADIGMLTFYVGPPRPTTADWAGGLHEVASLLHRLV